MYEHYSTSRQTEGRSSAGKLHARADTLSPPSHQRIRSKMDIRMDSVPRSIKFNITSLKYEKTESGSFFVSRGEVVSPRSFLGYHGIPEHVTAWRYLSSDAFAVRQSHYRHFMGAERR